VEGEPAVVDQLNVWGQFLTQAYDLPPGASHYWVAWGGIAENGVVPWITVAPFPPDPPGEKILQVSEIQHEATDDGARRILFSVTNVGPSYVLAYAMYGAWTDIIY
jgi:hypothetical protein